MRLQGTANQTNLDELFDASGTLAGTSPVLVLPNAPSRSFLAIQNIGSSTIYVDFGFARAGAVTMSGSGSTQQVASAAILNAGMGYTIPPHVQFLGGGHYLANPTFPGVALPNSLSPGRPAKGTCVMTGSPGSLTVASITIDDPGLNYGHAPFCRLINDPNDPYGSVAASTTLATFALAAGSDIMCFTDILCPTTPVVIVGSAGGIYTVKYAP